MLKRLKNIFREKSKINTSEDIERSKHFCMLPWIHTHLLPNGDVLPCCVSDFNDPYANVNDKSIKEAWNSDKYNATRKLMLSDRPVYSCSKCYELEESGIDTMRKQMNSWFKHHVNVLKDTKPDGSSTNLEMRYLDIRFSNICNFKCRGCSPALSSSWYEDHQKLWDFKSEDKKLINLTDANPALWEEIEDSLEHIEIAYFAGGEPLMMEEHYQCLELLIAKGKTDVELHYNTNMSVLKFKKYDLLHLWKQFKKINLSISIDDIEARGEYFRSGLNWSKFVENVNKVQSELTNAVYEINCTLQIFNIHRIPQIHFYFYNKKIIDEYGFIFNTLQDPTEYRTQVLPKRFKESAEVKLKAYMGLLKQTHPDADWSEFFGTLISQINYMNSEDRTHLLENFQIQTERLDRIRSESFKDTYPELLEMLDS